MLTRTHAVGANGAGKTNFFHGACAAVVVPRRGAAKQQLRHVVTVCACSCCAAAIRFVLSDLFVTMRAEDRQSLLHVRHARRLPRALLLLLLLRSCSLPWGLRPFALRLCAHAGGRRPRGDVRLRGDCLR